MLAAAAALLLLAGIQDVHCKERSLTNPLLKYMSFKEIRPFKYKIEKYLTQKKADGVLNEVAFYFRDLADGNWVGIDEDKSFSGASLHKVPLMIAYYKLAEKDPSILKKELKYDILMPEVRDYVPADMPVPGKYYTVDELIRIMIQQSDNNALIILTNNIDAAYPAAVIRYLGLGHVDENDNSDNVSLKNIITMFRVLYNASYLNVNMSEKALRCLDGTCFDQGIVAGVPRTVTVANKFGERYYISQGVRELHECAIVYYEKNPYLIGIMTRGKDYSKLLEIISTLSKMVYDEVDSQYHSKDEFFGPVQP